MLVAIWLLALILLLFWSAFAWMCHAVLGMISDAPWEQLLTQLKDLSFPEPLGQWWSTMVDILAPMLQASLPILQGLLSFVGSALPVIVIVFWALGVLALLLVAIAATLGAIWWRKSRTGTPGKLASL